MGLMKSQQVATRYLDLVGLPPPPPLHGGEPRMLEVGDTDLLPGRDAASSGAGHQAQVVAGCEDGACVHHGRRGGATACSGGPFIVVAVVGVSITVSACVVGLPLLLSKVKGEPSDMILIPENNAETATEG